MKKFEGKVVLVTGAGHGIGKQIAVQFAEQGANTVIVDYNVEFGTETAEEITRDYVKSCLLYTSTTSIFQEGSTISTSIAAAFSKSNVIRNSVPLPISL